VLPGKLSDCESTDTAENAELEIGSNRMIPGFEKQLVGVRCGEQKEIRVSLPEGYRNKDAAGKEGVFKVTVKEIKRKELPELDDEFAQQFGEYETMDQLRARMAEYLEKQGMPTRSLTTINGQDILTLKASGNGQPWFRLPWSACNGATDWQIHLNPDVPSEITAHSDGGNMELDLSSLAVSCLSADTGGGNLDVTLPDKAVDLNVIAKTGAGNVTVDIGSATRGSSVINASSGAGSVIVRVPDGLAARIHPASGMGKVIVNPRFSKLDVNTYQSPDYETAADRVEITIKSGAGNVSVDAR